MNKKNLRHLRNLRDKKLSQKDLCKSVKSVGHIPILWDIFHSQGVSATTEQVASAKIRE